jgi:glucose-1-phosphate adenylyltransferase
MLTRTFSIILAGRGGARFHPMTAERDKPAVPFGRKYCIFNFTLSNCLYSGLRLIPVLTQYMSHPLQMIN